MGADTPGFQTRTRTGGGPASRPRAGVPVAPPAAGVRRDDRSDETDGLLRRVGRVSWHVLVVMLPVLLLTGLAVGLGFVRLMHGPISLKPLAEPIARGLGAELPGLDIRIDDVILRWSSEGQLEFRLKHVRLIEQDGDLVASAPEAAAQLSIDGLWSWRLVPSRIDLIDPKLNLNVNDKGEIALTFSDAPPAEEAAESGAAGPGANPPRAGAEPSAGARPAEPPALKRIDLARMVADASRRARRGLDASSFLREVGMRNATITLDSRGRTSHWRVPEVSVDLEHKKRSSVIAGHIKVASSQGPWTIAFRTEESDKTRTLVLKTTIRDLVPRSVEGGIPALDALRALDLPIASDATIELSTDGEIRSAEAAIELGRGRIVTTERDAQAIGIDGGLLKLSYDAASRRVEMLPSQVRWTGGRMTLTGTMAGGLTTDRRPGWAIEVKATDGTFRADDLKLKPLPIDQLRALGHWLPEQGRLQVSSLTVRSGGAEVSFDGEVDTMPGTGGVRIEGRSGPMPLETFKTLWPQSVAPGARAWVGEKVQRGSIKSFAMAYRSGIHLKGQAPAAAAQGKDRLTLAVEAVDVAARPIPTMPPIEAPKALVNLESATLEVSVPDAAVVVAPGKVVPLKAGRFLVQDVVPPIPDGEISFRLQSPLQPVLAVLDHEPLSLVQKSGHSLDGVDGKVEGQIRMLLPLAARVDARDVKLEGRVRVLDGRGKQLVGGHDVQGATVTFDFAEHAIDAKGEMLVGGVLAKLGWQHIYDADEDRQPPLRITATLDNSDRNQLGLDLGHIVQGDVPVEVVVTKGARGEPVVRLRADLSGAELSLDAVAWRKPPGRAAYLQFDVAKGQGRPQRTEITSLKLAGDDVAIEGSAVLGPDNRLREFSFPDFTLNVVSRLDLQGKLSAANIWEIKARGTTFDGRDFFRSLFSLGQSSDRSQKQQRPRDGIDLEADIDTVLGFSDTSLKGLKIRLSKRAEKLVTLDARGTLDSGRPLAATVRVDPKEPRRLLADTTDAGQAFKLVGFYPNVQGGRARLEVNLDGKGPAEKTGTLWVEDFVVLGDPVVAEVVGSAGDDPIDRTGARTKQRIVRQAFNFDRMRAPFSVGHGQFVLDDTYVKGPILGANIRGKVDYRARTVNLGGTYVPLQGLNNVLGDIPLLGPILSGPRSEGIFGITFAIQGPMASPQVIVNPLSLLTPGITRELTQMAPFDAAVQEREEKKPAVRPELRTRASSAPAAAQRAPEGQGAAPAPTPIDGWSSETKATPLPKKK